MNQPQTIPANTLTRADGYALLVLGLLFLGSLLASWQRWTQPLLDHGRELNLPARLLAGEQLYTDVQFLYGPFAPYFNALLYRLFGVRMSVLHTSGALCAVLILLLIYWLARRLLGVWAAAVTTGLVLVICALKSTANYVQPYAYAALYGLVFALVSLVALLSWERTRLACVALAGLFAGLALIAKPEIALAAVAAAGAALWLESLTARRWPWRELAWFAAPLLTITLATYAYILSRVPWRVLHEDNHIFFIGMPPQLIYFNRHISGLAQWPASLWFSLTGLGIFLLWLGACLTLGALLARRSAGWQTALKRGLALLLIGIVWREAAIQLLRVPSDVTPFASAIFVLPGLIGWLGVRAWRQRTAFSPVQRVLFILAVFSLVAVLRAALNVTTTGPYTPFFVPVLIVVYLALLICFAPAALVASDAVRARVRQVAVCLLALMVLGMAVNSARRWHRLNTFTVSAPRGGFKTVNEIGEPLQAAIRYAAERTQPDEYVLALPVATMINFLAERRYPLREEIVHPGFLTGAKEQAAIESLKARRVRLVLLTNLDTSEFRDRAFGLDYNRELLRWIEANYHMTARFDSATSRGARLGDTPFFILAYERNQ
jgi:4-amino-4-deoxy-L-arabinose transferase-like glycosyltransferase